MPTTTPEHDQRIAEMTFASVYPHYLTKVEKKGKTKEELHTVITWLTGFDDRKIQKMIDDGVTFEKFFKLAKLNPNAKLITGVICGYRVEEIETPLTRQARYLDKLVDTGKEIFRVGKTKIDAPKQPETIASSADLTSGGNSYTNWMDFSGTSGHNRVAEHLGTPTVSTPIGAGMDQLASR